MHFLRASQNVKIRNTKSVTEEIQDNFNVYIVPSAKLVSIILLISYISMFYSEIIMVNSTRTNFDNMIPI